MAKSNSTSTRNRLSPEEAREMDLALTNVLGGLESLQDIAKEVPNMTVRKGVFSTAVEQMAAFMEGELKKALEVLDDKEKAMANAEVDHG